MARRQPLAQGAPAKAADLKVGRDFWSRGDLVRIAEIVPGKTARQTTIRFEILEKHRERAMFEVGDIRELNIGNFLAWSRLAVRPGR